MNDPIRFLDFDGMDVYIFTADGRIVLAKKEEKTDVLYSVDKNNKIIDTDKNGKIEIDDGVSVKTQGLLGQMSKVRSVYKGSDIYSIVSESFTQAEDDLLKLFHYISNNTHLEFNLTYFTYNKKNYISLSTYRSKDKTPGAEALGLRDKDIRKSYHNHPEAEPDYERRSMGEANGQVWTGDYKRVVDNKISHPEYVYFPKTTNLYNVTLKGIYFIQKINNDYKKLKK